MKSFRKLRLTVVQLKSAQRGRHDWKAGWDVKGYFSIDNRYRVLVTSMCAAITVPN